MNALLMGNSREVLSVTAVGTYEAVVPKVTGHAFITGFHQFVVDPRDDLKRGFLLGRRRRWKDMLVISANEQRNLVNMNEVIEYAALALKEFSAERTITPIRGHYHLRTRKIRH